MCEGMCLRCGSCEPDPRIDAGQEWCETCVSLVDEMDRRDEISQLES